MTLWILAMTKTTVERQHLIEVINTLPDEVLIEIASFLEYLRYKTVQHQNPDPPKQNFLLAVAALGNSGQTDIADTDEAILYNEIDSIHGWSSKPRTP